MSSKLEKPYRNLVQLDFDNYFRLSNKGNPWYSPESWLEVPESHYVSRGRRGCNNFPKYIIKPIYSARLIKIESYRLRFGLRILDNKLIRLSGNVFIYVRYNPRMCLWEGFGINILARSGQIEIIGVTERLIEPKQEEREVTGLIDMDLKA